MKTIRSLCLKKLTTNIYEKYFTGHKRSVRIKKHIIASMFLKGVSILISFALVPLSLDYLNPTTYGIWITLSSIFAWFSFFDIGLGHGLRNKFAEALAKDNKELAKTYVSTTYATLFLIIGTVYLLFLFINPFLDWTKILNTSPEFIGELSALVIVVFSFFCLRFILNLIGKILLADQRPAVNNSFGPVGNLISLIVIYILTRTTSGSILYLGIVMSFVPVFILFIATLYLFTTKYKEYRPRLKYVNFSYFYNLAGLGVQFFIIQIAGIVVFTSSNIIISHLFGPMEVTPYNIAYKYFSIITMLFAILITPVWSAVTEAYVKNEYGWIKSVLRKLNFIWLISIILVILMIVFSGEFYLFWIGDKVFVPFATSVSMGVFIILFSFNSIYSNIINGIGRLRLQVIIASCELLTFPIAAILLGTGYGVTGIITARILITAPGSLLMYKQVRKLVSGQARGIFNK